MKRDRLVNLLVLLLSCIVTLTLAEVVCRSTWHPAGRYHRGPARLYRYDPLLGWRLNPSATFERRTSEYVVVQRTNSHGLRCPELPLEKSAHTHRLMFLGDSFAEGYTVEWEHTCAAVAQRRMSELTGRPVDVVNGGCAGWSTDQQLLWFRTEGRAFRPDTTILLFYDNDIWYNACRRYWRGFKPRFAVVDGSLELVYRPSRPPSDDFDGDSPWWHHFVMAQFVADRIGHTEWLRRLAPFGGLPPPPFADEFSLYDPTHPTTREGWHVTEFLLATLRDEVKAIGSDFLVFLVPPRWTVYDDYRPRLVRAYGPAAETWNFSSVTTGMVHLCRRLNIEFLNPIDDFRRATDRLYFLDDGHWNVGGHATAGELIASSLEQKSKR